MTQLDELYDSPPSGYVEVSSELTERTQSGDLYWDHGDEEWLPIPRTQLGMYLASFCRVARKSVEIAVDCKYSVTCKPPQTPTQFIKRIRRTRGVA